MSLTIADTFALSGATAKADRSASRRTASRIANARAAAIGSVRRGAGCTEPDVWRALAQLEPRQRAALVLATIDGYTHAEIATMLGVREGTVSSWVSRSKDRLRALLGDER